MRVVFFGFYFSKDQNNFITGKSKLEEQWLGLGLGLGLMLGLRLGLGLFFLLYSSVLYFSYFIFRIVFFRLVY